MIRLNRKVEYALMALKFMSRKPRAALTSAKEIAEALQIPFDATARVLQILAHHDVLFVVQGTQGGYRLKQDLGKVSLYKLVEVIEGPFEIARCLSDEDCDLVGHCNIQNPIQILNRKIADFYQGLNLAEVLRLRDGESGRMTS